MSSRQAHLTDPALYRAFYEADLSRGRYARMPLSEPRLRWVTERLHTNDDVLDIGCHKGEMTVSLPLFTVGRVVGLDISANAIGAALHRPEASTRHISWLCSLGEQLPFRDQTFSAVILAEILEHVPDPEPVVTEAERVLRPGGKVFVSVPINALDIDDVDRIQRQRKLGYDLDMHVREFMPAAYFAGRLNLETTEEWVRYPGHGPGIWQFGFRLAAYEVGV